MPSHLAHNPGSAYVRRFATNDELEVPPLEGRPDTVQVRFVLDDGSEVVVVHKGKFLDVRNIGKTINLGLVIRPKMNNDVEVWTE